MACYSISVKTIIIYGKEAVLHYLWRHTQSVQTDSACIINIGMINGSDEENLWWLKGVPEINIMNVNVGSPYLLHEIKVFPFAKGCKLIMSVITVVSHKKIKNHPLISISDTNKNQ